MSANFIDRDASWESDSSFEFLGFLITENFKEFFLNEGINFSADG
jgi:hypothetical protein